MDKKMRFAHLADCHLGGWSQPELQDLNLQSFQKAVKLIIEQKLDFVLIAGDLFDSSYPSIDILKKTFTQFRLLHDNGIPVYMIPGSHDFSASGKTFLDVLERTGFAKSVHKYEIQDDGQIILQPTYHDNIAIYGYPGKKSGMEVKEIKNIKINELNQFTILMLHTTLDEVRASLHMESIEKEKLPLADYYCMGHIHQRHESQLINSKCIYPGPTFPNNFQELVDLQSGSFVITEINNHSTKSELITLPIKEIVYIEIQLNNGITATEKIIQTLDKKNLNDKIVLLRLTGVLTQGKTGDIRFNEIADFIKKKNAYSYIRNISSIKIAEEANIQMQDSSNEKEIIQKEINNQNKLNPNSLNDFLQPLMEILSIEKAEDERANPYEERLMSEIKGVLRDYDI
jgi:DNA repair protein SbcD/Mre11